MGRLRYYKKVNSDFLQYPMSQGKVIGRVCRRSLDGHNIFMHIFQLLQIGLGIMDIPRRHSHGGDMISSGRSGEPGQMYLRLSDE